MDLSGIISDLERNKKAFAGLLDGLHKAEYLWKPAPDKWCVLEVLCHLVDEEREDFRSRARHIMETPDEPLPAIDPVGWVESRKYSQQDFGAKLDEFMTERDQSLDWLRSLGDRTWSNSYKHPIFGKMTALTVLSNWPVHDFIHLRQIMNVRFKHMEKKSGENLSYAGDW